MTNQEAMEWLKFMWEQEHSKGDLSPTPCNTEIALQVAMDALKQPEIVRCKDCEHGVGFARIVDLYMILWTSIRGSIYIARNEEEW